MPKEAEKKSKKKEGIGKKYKVEGNELKRLRPSCERCGSGYFMADHGNRYTCGQYIVVSEYWLRGLADGKCKSFHKERICREFLGHRKAHPPSSPDCH